ncbi:hypothetical protein QBC32DRAFT_136000 [Pseudoneurospora amorphoporcata]|uniref:Uncharacterized protein n=1 Tax=Pseudoneurospora amorphoporcata TaxID=241081 RepID=A0AAN6NYZ9_9PEZI|nr:hypothetical protein QBC32DRAFT_136000 [Pseudoneurospora amorphoporcata]
MSVTVEEPQRGPEEPPKEASEQEPGSVDNHAHLQKNGQNDRHDSGASRIVMAYIPNYTPASPAPGCTEASDSERRPSTPSLTARLNQAMDEYRAREERVGDQGFEGDTNTPGELREYTPEYQQPYYHGLSPWGWTPYHPAFGPPLYVQPPVQQYQQQQYCAVPHHHSSPSPDHPHPYRFAHPPPPHLFAPYPSDPRISPLHFPPVSAYTCPPALIQAHPYPQPHPFQPPLAQDPRITNLTHRLQDIQDQLNGLDAAHEVEIWRHGKYNFHRHGAKQLRKIKRGKVEEMVSVVRELRGLAVSGWQPRGRCSPQPRQEDMCWPPGPGLGYGGEGVFEQGGSCGCGYVDSPRDSALESMAGECGTTVDGEASPDSSKKTETGRIVTADGTRARTYSLPLDSSMEKPSERVEAVETHEQQQHGEANENEQGQHTEKTSTPRERAGSWSEAIISEELRGIWREKMSI